MSKLHNLKGEQKKQLLITVDREGNQIGTASREKCHMGDGITHMAFMAFVIDKEKNIILTKRSNKKLLFGGFWDASVVSHVVPGETVEEATNRRGKEELGIDVPFQKIGAFYYFAKQKNHAENEYCYVLIGKTSQEIHPNPIEFAQVKHITFTDLINNIQKEKYTPWLLLSLDKVDLIPWL